jgi:hypothetical protein
MTRNTRTAYARELDEDDDAAIFDNAVVTREPDADVADGDLAWWLSRQEQAETQAALAAAGLL